MNELRAPILGLLHRNEAMTTTDLAISLKAYREHVQRTLHRMDDAGDVIMKNGFYKLSEKARKEWAKSEQDV